MLGARAQSREPREKRDRQIRKTFFLPRISLAFPARGMVTMDVNWCTLSVQPAKIKEASKEEVITGKATATAVPLADDSINTRLMVIKTRYRDMLSMLIY